MCKGNVNDKGVSILPRGPSRGVAIGHMMSCPGLPRDVVKKSTVLTTWSPTNMTSPCAADGLLLVLVRRYAKSLAANPCPFCRVMEETGRARCACERSQWIYGCGGQDDIVTTGQSPSDDFSHPRPTTSDDGNFRDGGMAHPHVSVLYVDVLFGDRDRAIRS